MDKKTIVTHDGSFHADDVFATATVMLTFSDSEFSIIRTREKDWFEKADIVIDVGKQYESSNFRFDHHQKGGAGVRENGTPYASFGLVWKEFGEKISGDNEVAEFVDQKLVCPIDGHDSGFDISKSINENISEYDISKCIASFNPTSLESNRSKDEAFFEAVSFAKKVIEREVFSAKERKYCIETLKKAYDQSDDKKILILDRKFFFEDDAPYICPETLIIVYPYTDKIWSAKVVRKNRGSFDSRIYFPESWVGKTEEEMPIVTGVKDARFCHNARFMVSSNSKEGAIELSKIAIQQYE